MCFGKGVAILNGWKCKEQANVCAHHHNLPRQLRSVFLFLHKSRSLPLGSISLLLRSTPPVFGYQVCTKPSISFLLIIIISDTDFSPCNEVKVTCIISFGLSMPLFSSNFSVGPTYSSCPFSYDVPREVGCSFQLKVGLFQTWLYCINAILSSS